LAGKPRVIGLTLLTVRLQVDLPADKQTLNTLHLDDEKALSPVEQLGLLFPSALTKRN
jgi:hypothetical protein